MLGSGSIIVFDDTTSVVELALRTARFYHHESCGKCTPCREGTNWTVKMLERMIRGEATPIDLETVASVQDNIIGNCLCVLGRLHGDARRRDGEEVPRRVHGGDPGWRSGGARRMTRPIRNHVSLVVDGREVTAPEGTMLHDAAKHGRRRDPGLLLRAEARGPGRRLPDVPGRDRGDAEAPDLVLHAGPRRDGRLHADRPRQGGPERGGRVSAGQPPARLPGLRQGRRVPAPGRRDGMGTGRRAASPTRSVTSRSRSSSRRWSRSTASAASSATAASASARRSPRTSSSSCWSAATRPSSGPSTSAPTSRPFTATSPSSARSGR